MKRPPLKLRLHRTAGATVEHLRVVRWGRTLCGLSMVGPAGAGVLPLCTACARVATRDDVRDLYSIRKRR